MHLTKEEQLLATGRISALFKKFAVPGVVGLLFIGLQPMIDEHWQASLSLSRYTRS